MDERMRETAGPDDAGPAHDLEEFMSVRAVEKPESRSDLEEFLAELAVSLWLAGALACKKSTAA